MVDAAPVLPEPVRAHLTELAATVLGELNEAECPPALRRVRAFAPARRARSGAGPLAVALDRDAPFRHRVAAAWRGIHPELAQALDAGELPATVDPHLALAGIHLLRPTDWQELERGLHEALARGERERRQVLDEEAAQAELAAVRAEVDRLAREAAARADRVAVLEEELAGLRRELRRHRTDADRARAAARQALEQAEADRRSAQAAQLALTQAQAAVRAAQEEARQSTDTARRAVREGRTWDETRLRLLLDTVVEAAGGLRRELALPPAATRPADLLVDAGAAGAVPARGEPGPDAADRRGLPADDPGLLAELLALPQVHLLVDGYNVTKSGWPAQTLAEQRRRLVEALAPVAARTGCEVTCCFDGADVEAAPASRVRGVRVLFSQPGVTADELIRRLVRAEPAGRPVVVVSTDGEVVAGVRAAGAHPVPSAALLRLLARS